MAEGADAIRVDLILRRVRPDPADRKLNIVQLRRPAISIAIEEPVIGRKSDVSIAREELAHTGHGALVEAGPAAAVKKYDARAHLRAGSGWLVDIEVQRSTSDGSVHDVFLDVYRCGLCLCRQRKGEKKEYRCRPVRGWDMQRDSSQGGLYRAPIGGQCLMGKNAIRPTVTVDCEFETPYAAPRSK